MNARQIKKIERANRLAQAFMIVGSALSLAIAVARGRKTPSRWYAIYPNDKHIDGAGYARR